MSITKEAILDALSLVDDPDIKKDLVTLNMIQDLEVDGKKVSFRLVLTTPACPLKEKIASDATNSIHLNVDKDIDVSITFDADVTSGRAQTDPVLPNVKNIIVVASGKGGVGKSTVSVNLAAGLAASGSRVGLIDADIYGPSIPLMLGITERPQVSDVDGKQLIEPIEKFGIKTLSMGFLVEEDRAVVWRGPMVSSALKQFVSDANWGELDYMIVDLPPGTGDVHLTLVQSMPVTGAVIVTTPQQVAIADVKKAIAMFRMPQINVPILGVVENMSYFIPPDAPDKKYQIFGEGGGERISETYAIPLLGTLPIATSVRTGGDQGTPIILSEEINGENAVNKEAFQNFTDNTARYIAMANASKMQEKAPAE